MLARSAAEVLDENALIDLYGAVARLAIKDFQAGPSVCGERHYQTAVRFLERSGLIDRVVAPTHPSTPHQLDLFTSDW